MHTRGHLVARAVNKLRFQQPCCQETDSVRLQIVARMARSVTCWPHVEVSVKRQGSVGWVKRGARHHVTTQQLLSELHIVKAAADASYLWLKLKDVVLGCPEVYFCVCYMPQKPNFNKIRPTPTSPYDCMQNDVLEYQGKGAQTLICGDFNARTAEERDFLRMADLQPFSPISLDEDELPDYIRQRRNKDLLAPGSQTWGPELLGFCQQVDLLILNGRTLGNEYGQFTFKNTKGNRSTIDYFVASAECFSAVKSLHALDEAARYNSDHNPLLLHLAYKAPCDTHTHTSSAASDARIRYDV